MTRMLQAAQRYGALGWFVLPLHSVMDGKCTCRKGEACDSPGKHPRFKGWQNEATTVPATMRPWWGKVAERKYRHRSR